MSQLMIRILACPHCGHERTVKGFRHPEKYASCKKCGRKYEL